MPALRGLVDDQKMSRYDWNLSLLLLELGGGQIGPQNYHTSLLFFSIFIARLLLIYIFWVVDGNGIYNNESFFASERKHRDNIFYAAKNSLS